MYCQKSLHKALVNKEVIIFDNVSTRVLLKLYRMVIRMILFRIIYLNVDGTQTRQHSNATKLVQSIMCVENLIG